MDFRIIHFIGCALLSVFAFCLAEEAEPAADHFWSEEYAVEDNDDVYGVRLGQWSMADQEDAFGLDQAKTAALQYFVWKRQLNLRLMWWRARDPEVRKLVMALIILGGQGDFCPERSVRELLDAAPRFKQEEAEERLGELLRFRSISIAVGTKLLADEKRYHLCQERIGMMQFQMRQMKDGLFGEHFAVDEESKRKNNSKGHSLNCEPGDSNGLPSGSGESRDNSRSAPRQPREDQSPAEPGSAPNSF